MIIEHRACVIGEHYDDQYGDITEADIRGCLKDVERGPINLPRLRWLLEKIADRYRRDAIQVKDTVAGATCFNCGMIHLHVKGCKATQEPQG